MELVWYQYLFLFIGGAMAGVINTLAGNGSTITLFLLMTFGLPADVANGTNRIGILFQSIIATRAYSKAERFKPLIKESWWIIALAIPGGIAGAIFASNMDKDLLKSVIGVLMVLMFFVILIKPKRWFRETDYEKNRKTILNFFLFIGIGFYAGFIQMGMGLFFLAIMVLGARYSLVDANILKIVITLLITIPALCIYLYQGQVNWEYGLALAAGQGLGAWLAAKFAINHPKANIWIHRLLVIMVLVAIVKLLGIYELMIGMMG
jgi:uncharacterized membrane protein YfcA